MVCQQRTVWIALVVAALWVAPALAGWCGDGHCELPETCGLCRVDCGTCEPVQLTSSPADDYDPAWSPDGVTIAFLSERNGIGPEIFAVDPEGAYERDVARYAGGPPWQFTDVSWFGMTGDLLAVDMRSMWEVVRIRTSQGPELPIVRPSEDGAASFFTPLLAVPGGQAARGPVVSPDARHLAWSALVTPWSTTPCERRVYQLRVHDGVLDTFSGNSDGQGHVIYSTAGGGYLEGRHALAFSPDGRELAFVAATDGWCRRGRRDVFIADLDTGGVRQLTTDGASGIDHGGVSWSSRNVIAFDAGGDLYSVNPDGSALQQLTATAWDEADPSWSPDGNALAYAANRDGNYDLFVLDGAGASTSKIRPKGSAGRYIVVLRDQIGSAARSTDERREAIHATAVRLLGRRANRMKWVYASSIQGFSARISRADAKRLSTDPDVVYVESDRRVHINQIEDEATCPVQSNPPSWGLDRIDEAALPLNNAFRYRPTDGGVNVYLIDTGIRTSHVEFGGRAHMVFSYDGTSDCNGHGTHVAGTIAGATVGVAKNASVFGLKVLDCSGSGWMSDVIAAVDWVTANHAVPAVANMSLGGPPTVSLDTAVQRSIASGVTYVVAAGNDGRDASTTSPARVAEAITVGASEQDDSVAYYSNYGGLVDVFAPGSGIVSAWVASDTARKTLDGTSMATPHVTGMAAIYLDQNPSASPAEVAGQIVGHSTRGVLKGVKSNTANRLLRVFGPCGPICGDGRVNQTGEECDDGNRVDGDGCDNNCYFTRFPCDVQCCDGSWQHVRARTGGECQSFGNAPVCNGNGGWTSLWFGGAAVGSAACSAQCGIECCSWSVTQQVGGIFNVRDRPLCLNLAGYRCGSRGSGVRNVLFWPYSGGPLTWDPHAACPSGP